MTYIKEEEMTTEESQELRSSPLAFITNGLKPYKKQYYRDEERGGVWEILWWNEEEGAKLDKRISDMKNHQEKLELMENLDLF